MDNRANNKTMDKANNNKAANKAVSKQNNSNKSRMDRTQMVKPNKSRDRPKMGNKVSKGNSPKINNNNSWITKSRTGKTTTMVTAFPIT